VFAALGRCDAEVVFLDQRVTAAGCVELSLDGRPGVSVRTREGRLDLARCGAAYLRPYDSRELPAVRRAPADSPVRARAIRADSLLGDWADLTDAFVVNRPSAMASGASKPWQARALAAAGFRVPDTLITTDADAVREFRARHDRIIYKSISGVRSIVAEFTDAHEARLEAVRWCPTQFQERVPGTDYRVHVVGDEVFAARIDCAATDYRYAYREGATPVITAARLPEDVEERCVTVTAALGLAFGGVDLRRAPDAEWYCFEVNPSPGFTFYAEATGQRIDDAVARLLVRGARQCGAPARVRIGGDDGQPRV
jgi:glutathione synthase/RimK-type ligase-like ATP-grasp enzyme